MVPIADYSLRKSRKQADTLAEPEGHPVIA
jgi:hypothetical protein